MSWCWVDWTLKVCLNDIYDALTLTQLYNDIIHLSGLIPNANHFDARLSPLSHTQWQQPCWDMWSFMKMMRRSWPGLHYMAAGLSLPYLYPYSSPSTQLPGEHLTYSLNLHPHITSRGSKAAIMMVEEVLKVTNDWVLTQAFCCSWLWKLFLVANLTDN